MKNVDARTCNKANTRAMPAALCLLACLLLACFAPARAWAADVGYYRMTDVNGNAISGMVDVNTISQGFYLYARNMGGTASAVMVNGNYAAMKDMINDASTGEMRVFIPASSFHIAPNAPVSIECYTIITANHPGVTSFNPADRSQADVINAFSFAITGNDEIGTGDAGQGTTDTNGGSAGGGGAGSDGTTNVEQAEEGNAPATPDASTSADAPSEEFDGSLSDEGSPASNPAQAAARRDVANDSDLGEATSVSDLSSNGMGDAASTLLAAGGAFSAYAAQPALLTGAQLLELGGVFSLSGAMKQPEEKTEQPEDEAVDAIDVELFGVPLLFALLCALLGGAAPFGLLRRGGMFAFRRGSTSRLRRA